MIRFFVMAFFIIFTLTGFTLSNTASACDACGTQQLSVGCQRIGHQIIDGQRLHDGKNGCVIFDGPTLANDGYVRVIVRPVTTPTRYERPEPFETTVQRHNTVRREMGEAWWRVHGHKVR